MLLGFDPIGRGVHPQWVYCESSVSQLIDQEIGDGFTGKCSSGPVWCRGESNGSEGFGEWVHVGTQAGLLVNRQGQTSTQVHLRMDLCEIEVPCRYNRSEERWVHRSVQVNLQVDLCQVTEEG